MENDMKLVGEGKKDKDEVLRECVTEMKKIFNRVHEK